VNPGPPAYSYDAENHLLSTAGVNYTYDGDGNRVEKSNGTIYWHGGLDESNLSGTLTNEYIFFGGARIARRDPSSNVFYNFADHLGTARSIAEVPSGQTTATKCYDADLYPFGGERWYSDTCDSHYKFTGKERDSESGLDNFGARYNSSNTGRFMSPDSVGYTRRADPQRWNLYAYVSNNPLSRTDPDGHDWFWIDNKWQWQKGHKWIDPKTGDVAKDKNGKDLKGYRYLLVFSKTGTNANGAATGTLTLFDQNTQVFSATAFSGGVDSAHGGLSNGGYMIRLDLPQGTAGASDVGRVANYAFLLPEYGVQHIPSSIDVDGNSLNFQGLWGSTRIRLNEMPGETSEGYLDNYLHGRTNIGDFTHNCICNRSEDMINKLLELGPLRVPVEVQ